MMAHQQEAIPEPELKSVVLPLSEAGNRAFYQHLSSNNYANLMLSVLMPFDLLFTYFFRYGRVANWDMVDAQNGQNPAAPDAPMDNGPMIEYTMAHPGVGAAVTLAFITMAGISLYWEAGRQQKIKNNSSAKHIFEQLKTVKREGEVLSAQDEKEEHPGFNDYIQELFRSNEHLTKKYKKIEFIGNDIQVTFQEGVKAGPESLYELNGHSYSIATFQDDPDTSPVEDESGSPRHGAAADKVQDKKEASISLGGKISKGLKEFGNQLINKVIFPLYQSACLASFVFGKQLINKVIFPLYQSACLASFVYWILWIGSGIFTGQFLPFAIVGMPDIVALGVPLLAGLAFPALKIYNYFSHDPLAQPNPKVADDADKAMAEKDVCVLLRRALSRQEYEIEKRMLERKLRDLGGQTMVNGNGRHPHRAANGNGHANGNGNGQANGHAARLSKMDQAILSLRNGGWFKPLLVAFSVASGSYVAIQYCTWIISTFVNYVLGQSAALSVLGVTTGWLLLAGALGYGIYKGVERYIGIQKTQEKVNVNVLTHADEVAALEERFEAQQRQLAQFGNSSHLTKKPVHYMEEQFFVDTSRRGPNKWTTLNKFNARLFQFINGACTGIFLARCFFVTKSALTIPSFLVASLSYPATVAALVIIGTAYGAFKVYEYHQQRKEAHAKSFLAARTERIECLREEVILGDLRLAVCLAERAVRPAVNGNGAVAGINGRAAGLFNGNRGQMQVAPAEVELAAAPNGLEPEPLPRAVGMGM
jgi:hypothetical protein